MIQATSLRLYNHILINYRHANRQNPDQQAMFIVSASPMEESEAAEKVRAKAVQDIRLVISLRARNVYINATIYTKPLQG